MECPELIARAKVVAEELGVPVEKVKVYPYTRSEEERGRTPLRLHLLELFEGDKAVLGEYPTWIQEFYVGYSREQFLSAKREVEAAKESHA